MKFTRTHVAIAASIGVVAIGVLAPAASGTPAANIDVTSLVTADLNQKVRWNSDGVKFQTKAPTDVSVVKLDLHPGADSGWHHHPGLTIVAVQSGLMTFTDSKCHSVTYGPNSPNGSVWAEGGDTPHLATSANGATAYVTFVAPDANPHVFRIDDPAPPCA
jgi:quercetin dioxygenase-like cupin family protein